MTAPSRVGRWVPTTDAQVAEVAPETLRGLVTALLDAPAVARLEGSTTPVVATELDGRAAWVVGTATTGGRL
ncbi:MAG: hypothetical protein IE926_09565, partial [Micrococcales bacterium]|nr:hypothetical protein [Micrococcales bacterium]